MNPERWQQIEALFQSVVTLPTAQRAVYLQQICQGDTTLQQEVAALLAADQKAQVLTLGIPAQIAAEMISQPPAWQSGQTLNHYTIVSQLGAGGMGVVYLAQDTRLRRKVALKVLPAALAQNEGRLRRFEQEALAASALNHPNILTIHEFETAGTTHFLASEFIDGETLRARLQRAALSVNEALDISTQIAQALAAAHEAHIIHRDIKPENVMLRKDGIVKVLDFGLAKLSMRDEGGGMRDESEKGNSIHPSSLIPPPSTISGLVMGTVRYMSPEQARGEQVDARTDIFSLGIVLYEMVAGRTPFAGATMEETMDAILHHEPLPLLDAPAGLQAIVQKTLQKDRAQRYASSREMLAALEQLHEEWKLQARLQSIPTGALPGQPDAHTPRVLRAIKRHQVSVGAALIVVVAVVAGGAFAIAKWFRNPVVTNKPAAALKVTPLTVLSGLESKPSFSPDGKQIAFSWVGERGDNTDIYIKEIGGEGMRRLTTHSGIDSDAVWSPDGHSIAFFRITEEGGAIYVMPSLGGVERKLTEISPLRATQILQADMSWSPDGKLLAVTDRSSFDEPMGIVLVSLETGERRQLTTPIPNTTGDYTPSFSPDGKTILFNRSVASEAQRDGYLVPASGGEPQKITALQNFLTSLDWLPDGKGIVYAIFGGNEEGVGLWKMALPNGTPERLTGRERNILGVVSDRHRNRLIYITGNYDIDIWRMELQAGKAGQQPPTRFIHSTKVENTVMYSQDGKTIAFNSMRSGYDHLWFCDADGQNPRQITVENKRVGGSTWSPDGRQIAFSLRLDDKSSIYVMNAEGRQKVRLSDGKANDSYPIWSHDGKWIYFRSDRTGQRELWKMPAQGGEPLPVLKRELYKYAESWDGKFLIYAKGQMSPGLWRLDLATGEESLLTKVHNAGYWWSWDVSPRGIYFASCETPLRAMVEFYDFATGKVSLVANVRTPFPAPLPGLSVSPDERWLCYLQQDLEGDLLLMENVE